MIHTRTPALVIAALSLAGVAAVWAPGARSQVTAMPSWVPIGVSSTGNGSTVWFHEPSSRQALACHALPSGPAGATSVQCVQVKLP